MNSQALAQAACAWLVSRSRSCVSQVYPSPIRRNVTRSPNDFRMRSSAVSIAPLMNCTIATFMPWPRQRRAIPSAAVVFPFPAPV